ncbi:hypothetical protein A2973_03555 [Candidatus Gottesmanbacteria bacterium RIFCSPLOWO2_01_FULL_49_10]|uniref:Uncharacterized protein n=1 Tax=Candidatus Gottesmanbacteria bacterium RIFCSPLOWO2_01_FULL_49_10 TaxID=1798396 RepID=A0A1F6B0U1_9BACT|nr:MAG: hypothetical protein A2973_03555 [Candidatus Gottesmanbacteria bacterium RIFCSPLOWO2_01_FULL_49_10]
MPQPGSIIGAFTDELGELGKQVVREVANVPKDIAGKALESLGTTGGKKQSGQKAQAGSAPGDKPALGQFEQEKDKKTKEAIARAALAELAGVKPKQREPSVRERLEMENEQKKQTQQQQQTQTAKSQLPNVQSKRKRGDLFGIKAKRNPAEMKNTRQD